MLKLFETAQSSDFLTGRDGKWHSCGFDWIINHANAVKILEGNYDNKAARASPNGSNNPFFEYANKLREGTYDND